MRSDATHLCEMTLTAADLIAELEQLDPATPVLITTNYGDISNTQQALCIRHVGQLEDHEWLHETAYSMTGVAVESLQDPDIDPEDRDDDATDRMPREVFIIRT